MHLFANANIISYKEMALALFDAEEITFAKCFENLKPGLVLEFGVYQGERIEKIANLSKRKVIGFDSFQGLPENWWILPKGFFACEPPIVTDNISLVIGWFKDTLPKFVEENKHEKVAFMHIDCDLYSSTKCVFDNFKDMFQDGSVIVFDEIIGYTDWENHEFKAFNEFLSETNYKWDCIGKLSSEPLQPKRAAFVIYK